MVHSASSADTEKNTWIERKTHLDTRKSYQSMWLVSVHFEEVNIPLPLNQYHYGGVQQDGVGHHPTLSTVFRDPFVRLSPDLLTATGYKGWTTVLLSHGSHFGCWYFEAIIGDQMDPSSNHIQQTSSVSALPLRFSGHVPNTPIPPPHVRNPTVLWLFGVCKGVSLRDVDGSICFDGHRIPYAARESGKGSIFGCGLVLGPCEGELPNPRLKPELYVFLKSGLLCDPLRPPTTPVHQHAKVQFSINGQPFPPHDIQLRLATYHPGISLFMGATCRINPGPIFTYEPPALDEETQRLTGFQSYMPAYYLRKVDHG